jgi:hypothetical protein
MQTGSDSPKLKPGFANPKLKSSGIGRTSLIHHISPIVDVDVDVDVDDGCMMLM